MINVTRSSMPDFEEYCAEIRDLWDSRWLTNMGEKHQALEQALRDYLGCEHLALTANGHLALETCVLLFTVRFGVLAMALGQLGCSLAAQAINAWPNRRLLDYSYPRQLMDMLPAILLSAAMAAPVWALTRLGLGDVPTLLLQLPLGVALYVLGSWALKLDSFVFLLTTVKKFLGRGAKAPADSSEKEA